MTGALRAEGLEKLRETMGSNIESGAVPGMVWLVASGDDVRVDVTGRKSPGGAPMQRDTIFRITSMTKPVTATAVMMLAERGRLSLDEPAARFLPELANRQVLSRIDAPLDDTVPAAREIVIRDLMNFTLGFGLLFDPNLPIQQAIDSLELANGAPVPQTPLAPDEWMKRLGTLPLMHQPGATWMYNTGSLVLGVLIARASGRPLEDFFRTEIFDPLGMTDTAFWVPRGKLDRFLPTHGIDFQNSEIDINDETEGQWSAPPPFPSGAAGLVSTIDDYYAFARMLLNRGELGGARLLSEKSVREITRDQLTREQKAGAGLGPGFFDSLGWGYGLAVVTAPSDVAPVPGRYGWNGGYGTSWSNDPASGLIGILMTQSIGYYISSSNFHDFWVGANAAVQK